MFIREYPTRTRTRTHTHAHAHAHTRTHAHTHTRTHAHTHTHVVVVQRNTNDGNCGSLLTRPDKTVLPAKRSLIAVPADNMLKSAVFCSRLRAARASFEYLSSGISTLKFVERAVICLLLDSSCRRNHVLGKFGRVRMTATSPSATSPRLTTQWPESSGKRRITTLSPGRDCPR